MTDARPDPDQLLAQVKAQEASARRGRLRIYFGASAGVGKTYAMLTAARQLRHEGKDVVVGLLETHGRKETEALLQGLEILPRAKIVYQDRTLDEFDLDAALARRPALILVDELAHTNAPGSRHPKRWQDIDELLAAGIDVFTTLNVQHLESLNDVVGGITGINVWETVPDSFFDQADEVVLVDVSADDLLARLAAGKVYLPEQIERAASNFFRKGNLMALRELALRRTADRVEDDVQAYRSDKSIERVWKTEDSLLCCIGPGPGGDDVVRSAARLAAQLGVEWTAAYVETPGAAAPAGGGARADPEDRQAGAGVRREDRDSRRRQCGGGSRRIRPHAQLLEAGGRTHARPIEMALGSRDRAPHRGAGARYRPDRSRARHRAAHAVARVGGRCRDRPAARRQAAALPVGAARVPGDDARRHAVACPTSISPTS